MSHRFLSLVPFSTCGRALRTLGLAALLATTAMAGGVGCSQAVEDDTATGADAVSASERAAIMNALRAEVKPELGGQDIVFNVSRGSFRAERGWCWLMGNVELRSGGEPSTEGTAYEEDAREGLFDGFHIQALLKKEGATWKVVTHGIGSTDAWWQGIEGEYPETPRSIFPWQDYQRDPAAAPARPERGAVMDALRAVVKPDLAGQDIVFNVSRGAFEMEGDYCWLQGSIQLRSGGEPSTEGTAHEEDAREGIFVGFHVEALLKRQGGRWTVLEHGVGSTDVWWEGIETRHPDAPRSIFPWLR